MDKLDKSLLLFGTPELQKKKNIKNNKSKISSKNKSSISFSSLFDEKLKTEDGGDSIEDFDSHTGETEIQKHLKEISSLGRRLKKTKSLECLLDYKKEIKTFINKILEMSEEVTEKTMFNPTKRDKFSKIHLKIINEELLSLTRVFMDEQKDFLKIASHIDRIEGILLDLAS